MEIPKARTQTSDAELDEALARAIRQLITEAVEAETAAV